MPEDRPAWVGPLGFVAFEIPATPAILEGVVERTMRLDRLVKEFSKSWRPVIVAAVDGSGKRQLAAAVARAFDAQIVSLGAADWIEAIGSDDPLVIVERSVRAVDPAADRDLAEALELRTSDQPLLVSARRFGPRVQTLRSRQVVGALTERELWFSPDDLEILAAEHGGTPKTAQLIHELTNGWPQLIWDLQGFDFTWGEVNGLRLTSELRGLLNRQMETTLQQLAPEQADVLTTLAFVDSFSAPVVEQLSTHATLDDLVDAGLPLHESGGGWYQGRALEAIEAALNCGQVMHASEMLAGLTSDQTVSMDQARLIAAIDQLGSARSAHPRSYLVHAQICFGRGDLPAGAELLATGIQAIDEASGDTTHDAGLEEELQAELAMFHYLSGDLDAAQAVLPVAPAQKPRPSPRFETRWKSCNASGTWRRPPSSWMRRSAPRR